MICAVVAGLVLPLLCGAAQFVEIKAEVEADDWNYWFFTDKLHTHPGEGTPRSIINAPRSVRLVVGTNSWMLETSFGNGISTDWFTGTNFIEHSLVTNKLDLHHPLLSSAEPGAQVSQVLESVDGNPGRPVRVADLMTFDAAGRFCWLALCSGPALKREERKINPPSDLWKEVGPFEWSDRTEIFKDGLGLPESVDLVSDNGQAVFQYQTRQTTNVLGWTFPLEFYGVQYVPSRTNGWRVHVTFKGKVTAIGAGTEPQIPVEVRKAVGK